MEARAVVGTSGKYTVNRKGEVFGPRGKLKQTLLKIGYYSVALSFGNRSSKRVYVHRLVAEAFLGPIPSGTVVDHINHDKSDNRMENLRVVSRKENSAAWVKTGARVNPRGASGRSSHCKRGHLYAFTSTGQAYCPTCRKLKREGEFTRPTGEWRETGIEGYSVSSQGEIWSSKSSTILKPGMNGAGYFYVHIGGKVRAIHRLVATAFLGSVSDNYVVDHIDGDKLNNCVENLRIITRSENSKNYHSRRLEKGGDWKLQAELKWLAHNTDIPQRAIADRYSVSQTYVSDIKTGEIHRRVDPVRPKLTDWDHYVRKRTSVCPVCSKEYEMTRSDKKFCSSKCRHKARRWF